MKTINDLFKEVVISMYGCNCILCGCEAHTVHHIYEKGMGGCSINQQYNPINGVPLCTKCHTKIHSEIGEVRGRDAIFKKVPALKHFNYQTHPLKGVTESEVRKELKLFLQ